jgi:hypothetical protein
VICGRHRTRGEVLVGYASLEGGQAVECGGMGSSGTPVTIYFAQSYPRLRVWARATRVGVRGHRDTSTESVGLILNYGQLCPLPRVHYSLSYSPSPRTARRTAHRLVDRIGVAWLLRFGLL